MKTIDLLQPYNLINEAKLTKLDDADKFKVIKAIQKMKPIIKAFEDFRSDAAEKLKDDNFNAMQKRAVEWNKNYAGLDLKKISDEAKSEREEIVSYFDSYQTRINDCLKEEAEKDIALEIVKLSEDSFGKLISSNDWKVSDILILSDILV